MQEALAEKSSKRRRWALRALGAVVVIAVAAILLRALVAAPSNGATAGARPTTTPAPPAPAVGHLAPAATLLTPDGQRVTLEGLRGKVVALNFWYASCEPCLYEMPTLEKTYLAQHDNGLVVLGVDVSDDPQTMRDFTRKIGVTYPVVYDPSGAALSTYQLSVTPTTYFIDRHGAIRAKVAGSLDGDTLRQTLAPLLAAQG